MTAWTPLLPSTLRARIALLLVLSMGFALRLLISPRAPIHANNHGIHEIRVILVNALSATGKKLAPSASLSQCTGAVDVSIADGAGVAVRDSDWLVCAGTTTVSVAFCSARA